MNMGIRVKITFNDGYVDEYRNVTEIHFGYKSVLESMGTRVAFESNIHGTGFNCLASEIKEFETSDEDKLQEKFWM